ncbi:MAG: gp53-like domain-containing protein [Fusobacteriaceae bacterium]
MAISLNDFNLKSLSGNGYARLPNGMILQWGNRGGLGQNVHNYTSFPIAFSSDYRIVFQKTSAQHSNNTPMRLTVRELHQFAIWTWDVWAVDWFAIGW